MIAVDGPTARSGRVEAETPSLQVTILKPETTPRLFKSAQPFEAWLKKHHATSDGLWLQIAKKAAKEPSVTYAEAVDLALCFGWIDGQKKPLLMGWTPPPATASMCQSGSA